MKRIICCGIVIWGLWASRSVQAALFPGAGTNLVFSLSGKLSGTQPSNKSFSMSSNQLLNYIRNRDFSEPIPANEVLAFIVNCEQGVAALAVYDTVGHSNLVLVAESNKRLKTANATAATTAWYFEVLGGSIPFQVLMLEVVTTATLDENGCPVKLSATLSGGLYPVVQVANGAFVVTKGKLKDRLVDTFVAP
jgi:hypothetical protein